MKKKSVNRKVMSSIGVSLLATVTTCTNVYAAAPALVEDGNSVEAQVFSIENEPVTSSAATQGSSKMQDELEETPVLSGESSVKEELDKAQEAVGATGEEKPLEEAVNNIGGALEEAQEAVDHVKTDIENLDDLNQKADEAVENYTEKVEDPEAEELIETWADNVEKANESAEAANEQASKAKDNADKILEDVTAAQSNSNRSEEEAAAAKSQAQEEAKKAQEEYEKAEAAQEAAQKEVTEAEDSLKAVEKVYDEAQKAYEKAATAVENAQKALEAIKGNGEIEIDGVTYKGNSKEAQEAAQKAKAKAEEAFKEAEKNLESATIEYNNAEELLKLTTAKMEIISSIQNETNKEEAYKKLEENLEAIDNEEITEANEAYKTATGQLENLDIAIAEKEAADLKVDECTDENIEKLVEQENGIINAFDEYQNVPDDFLHLAEKNSAKDKYYNAADKLAEAIVIYQLESAGMSVGKKPLDGYWTKLPDDGKNYMRMTYQENGATRVAYFNYVTKPDGTIDVLYRPSTYNSVSGSLQVEIVDNKTVFKLDGKEIAAEKVKCDGTSYWIGATVYIREKFEGTGNPYYPAQKLVDYKVEQSKAIEAQKEADEKLRQEIGNSKNSGLVDSTLNEELTKDNIAAIRAEASTSTQNKGNDLANAVGKYAEDLVNQKNNEEAQKNAANDKKNNIINRNEQLTNVIGACSHVINIVEKIKDLQAQADVSRDQLDQLEAKRNEVEKNYKNASDKATVAAELVAQAGEAAAEAMRIAGLDFLFTSASTTPTIPTTPTTPDGGGTGTTDPDNGGGTGTTDPGYGGDGTGTDVGGTGTTDVAAAEDTGATTPGGADMMADGSDATALVATAAVLPDGAEPIALAAGGNMNAGAAAGVDAGEATDDEADGLRVVEEEEVPLANADLESIDEDAEEESAEVRQIEDEETPLADLDLETEKSRMSWWWLLIIAVCGATGYEMYKKHKKKMEAENAMK